MLHSSRTIILGSDRFQIMICLPSVLASDLRSSTLRELHVHTLESAAEFEHKLQIHEFQIVIVMGPDKLHIQCMFEDMAYSVIEDLPQVTDINTYLQYLTSQLLSRIERACTEPVDDDPLISTPSTLASGVPIYDYSSGPFGPADDEPMMPLLMGHEPSPYDTIGPLVDDWLRNCPSLPPHGRRPRE